MSEIVKKSTEYRWKIGLLSKRADGKAGKVNPSLRRSDWPHWPDIRPGIEN